METTSSLDIIGDLERQLTIEPENQIVRDTLHRIYLMTCDNLLSSVELENNLSYANQFWLASCNLNTSTDTSLEALCSIKLAKAFWSLGDTKLARDYFLNAIPCLVRNDNSQLEGFLDDKNLRASICNLANELMEAGSIDSEKFNQVQLFLKKLFGYLKKRPDEITNAELLYLFKYSFIYTKTRDLEDQDFSDIISRIQQTGAKEIAGFFLNQISFTDLSTEAKVTAAHILCSVGNHILHIIGDKLDKSELIIPKKCYKMAIELFAFDQNNLTTVHAQIDAGHILMTILAHRCEIQESLEIADNILTLQETIATKHIIGKNNIRFITRRSANRSNIGHLMSELDIIHKLKVLGWRSDFDPVFLAPKHEIVNMAGLDLLRPFVCTITDANLLRRFLPLIKEAEYNTFWLKLPQGMRYFWSGILEICRAWDKTGNPPLLKLPNDLVERGYHVLRKLGVKENQWFVPAHIRDQTYDAHGNLMTNNPASHRNSDINTYRHAFQAIHERGGVVLRLGDRTMRPLTPQNGVIDYAFSEYKSDWMDLFLIEKGRFLIGTASGMNCLPMNFGTPSLLTNVSSMNVLPLGRNDLFIPKLLRRKSDGQFLSFAESLAEPFYYCFNTDAYDFHGVEVISNTDEELREVVIEMLDQLEGKSFYTANEEDLQLQFRAVLNRFEKSEIACRLGQKFLNRYSGLI